MYHILIPPSHHPARPWPLLRLGTYVINGTACHLCHYGCFDLGAQCSMVPSFDRRSHYQGCINKTEIEIIEKEIIESHNYQL